MQVLRPQQHLQQIPVQAVSLDHLMGKLWSILGDLQSDKLRVP